MAGLAEHRAFRRQFRVRCARTHLFRIRRFYDTYPEGEVVSAALRQLPWTHQLIIFGQAKRPEESEFYPRLAIRKKWRTWEWVREFKTALFENIVLNPPNVSPLVCQIRPDALWHGLRL